MARAFGTSDPKVLTAIFKALPQQDDYTGPKLDTVTQRMADSVSDNPFAMFLEAPGAAFSLFPTLARESLAQGAYGLEPGQFTDEMEQRIKSGEGTFADNIGRGGDAVYGAARYALAPEVSLGADVGGLFGRAINVGPGKALGEAAQGFVQGLNPFEEGLDPFERASRAANLGMMLHGAVRGGPGHGPERGPGGKSGPGPEGRAGSTGPGPIGPDVPGGAVASRGADGRYDLPEGPRGDPPRDSAIPGKNALLGVTREEKLRGTGLPYDDDYSAAMSFLRFVPDSLLKTLRLSFEDHLPNKGDAGLYEYRAANRGIPDPAGQARAFDSLARISRTLGVHGSGTRPVATTIVHEIAHHFEWFLSDKDRKSLINLYERDRANNLGRSGEYRYSNPSEWWVDKVTQFERDRFDREAWPFYKKLLAKGREFLEGAMNLHESQGNHEAARELYDEILRLGRRTKEGDAYRIMQPEQNIREWRELMRSYEELNRTASNLPRGVMPGNGR